FIAQPLSYDHKPDKPDERKRILGCGGRIGCRQMAVPAPVAAGGAGGLYRNAAAGTISVPVGPCRVWYSYRGDTLGLAMSRSLGDSIVHNCGVTAEPEIIPYKMET